MSGRLSILSSILFFFVQLTALFPFHPLGLDFIVPIEVIYRGASRQLFDSTGIEEYTPDFSSTQKFNQAR